MTLQELNQLPYLLGDIDLLEQRVQRLREQATSVNYSMGCERTSGRKQDKPSIAVDIVDCEKLLEIKRQEYQRLMAYIDAIDDSLTHQVFCLRFIEGVSWEMIADTVGGKNTSGSTKMLCIRYLRKHQ